MGIYSFLTIQVSSSGLYKDKGSKFLAFCYPVATENEIKAKLKSVKKGYFDASHHAYAFVLGAEGQKFKASDDGEPNHSAGTPILGQLRSRNLTNVLLIVVRYFGGTKLGVAGLVSAYKKAAQDALSHATIVVQKITIPIEIRYAYPATAEIIRLIKDFDLIVVSENFGIQCILCAEVSQHQYDTFREKIKLLQALGVVVQLMEG